MKPDYQNVRAWEEGVIIPTYPTQAADLNPMFLEKRVYQGSSGKVYPNPFTDRLCNSRSDKRYRGVFLENEFVQLMILPEIGGRIHIAQDKTNGYDFFYRQNVIKPALVGLLGPWISGGVEFNWPQHHRPSTHMPVQHAIERGDDGSVTVWLSEHEPMQRMKGMVGICLHPGKSYIEVRVRLYNRTAFVQTFLWWTNIAVRVHEEYQAFFPPDVAYVADHAKRAMTSFPAARNCYYGVDYGEGVDISWYRNIPVPTSYMVTESKYDFFGGYDHSKKAGFVHFADRHIAPGKKLWTWGNAEFGYAWDRNLTDSDGPYIELMAGSFTDNQPDFSWLQPYETRTWSQFWYPIQKIGPVKNANRQAAITLERHGNRVKVGVCVTETFSGATVLLVADGAPVIADRADLAPGRPFVHEQETGAKGDLLVRVLSCEGRELIRYHEEVTNECAALPSPATEPPVPHEIASNDELLVTGLHLEQYRHATRYPEPYWEEVLRRDPLDSRCNTQLGLLKLRRGRFTEAEQHFRNAIARLTARNPNPVDGEPHYYLGLTLQHQGRLDDAYAMYYKAAWNYAWQSAAYFRMAEIECRRGQLAAALEFLDRSLETNSGNINARNLKAAALRRLDRKDEARLCASTTLRIDALDVWSRNELALLADGDDEKGRAEQQLLAVTRRDVQLHLDLAFDYANAGFLVEAADVLSFVLGKTESATYPMVLYALASFADRSGDSAAATAYRQKASRAAHDYCFPARLQEMLLLEEAVAANPEDAKAPYYLGNLLYDKKRYEEAITAWERSVDLDPALSIPWRNLGIAYFNVRKEADRALSAYETAFAVNPGDARLLYELDQLRRRTGTPATQRLADLEQYPELVSQRDDLTLEVITLHNQTGKPQKALDMLLARRFNPWEGGEGLVSGQYVWSHLLLARQLLETHQPEEALAHFDAARKYPDNLGEGRHLLTLETHLDYFTGLALRSLGREVEARDAFLRAAQSHTDCSWMTYYRALALAALGRRAEANSAVQELREFANRQMEAEVKIDYFATSLPNFLLFEDDLQKRNRVDCLFLLGLADLAEDKLDQASGRLLKVLELDGNHLAAQEELRTIAGRNTQMAVAANGS